MFCVVVETATGCIISKRKQHIYKRARKQLRISRGLQGVFFSLARRWDSMKFFHREALAKNKGIVAIIGMNSKERPNAMI